MRLWLLLLYCFISSNSEWTNSRIQKNNNEHTACIKRTKKCLKTLVRCVYKEIYVFCYNPRWNPSNVEMWMSRDAEIIVLSNDENFWKSRVVSELERAKMIESKSFPLCFPVSRFENHYSHVTNLFKHENSKSLPRFYFLHYFILFPWVFNWLL